MSDIDPMSDEESHVFHEENSALFGKQPVAVKNNQQSAEFYSPGYQNKNNYNDFEGDLDDEGDYPNENDEDFNDYDDENEDVMDEDAIDDNSSLGLDTEMRESNAFLNRNNIGEQPTVEFSKNDQLKMIYMRSFIKKVDKNFDEKDMVTQNIRQEISGCKERLENLEKKRDDIFRLLQYAQNESDM